MSLPLRVKIQYTAIRSSDGSVCKFVYLIDSPAKTTIRALIALLQQFISSHFGAEDLRLMQLVTEDGFLLMEDDLCAHVLISNEQLVCVDMYQFIVEHLSTFNTDEAWFTLEQQESNEDSVTKKLIVGLNSRRQVYVYLFGNDDVQALHLFSVSDLLRLAHDRRPMTPPCSLEIPPPTMKIGGTTPSTWSISAEWEWDLSSSDDNLFLLCQLRADEASELQKGRIRLDLNRKSKTIDRWEVVQLSHPNQQDELPTELDPARLNALKNAVPPARQTGPVIDTSISATKLQSYESQGDSAIQMVQGMGSSVAMVQEQAKREGTFRQLISISHVIISKKQIILPEILTQKQSKLVEKSISVARIHVQYQRSDGKWVDCEEARLLLTEGQQKLASSILNIEPDKLISITVEAAVQIKGEPNRYGSTRNRAHRSFSQPLKLKIIVTDNVGKTCSLIVEQLNEPLVLITEDRFLEQQKHRVKKLIAFISADDCHFDERLFLGLYINFEDYFVISKGSSSVQMNKVQIRSDQLKAKKSRKSEELIEHLSDSNTKAVMLFDPESFLFYAIRVELTTSTSKTIETVFVPLDEIK